MNARIYKIMTSVFVAVMLAAPSISLAQGKGEGVKLTPKAVELKLALRSLWGDHIVAV